MATLRDTYFMKRALDLATRASVTKTKTNPRVGCVIVADDRIVGEGHYKSFGGPHAEVDAIADAGEIPEGACFYVTLEPCSFTGKTPPCTEALINAKPKRVVIGTIDDNPKVGGNGVRALEEAGIEVVVGVSEKACRELNEHFFFWCRHERPFVEAKVAITGDGKSASGHGEPRLVITGAEAAHWTHRRRALHDAIAVGVTTAIEDKPRLDCRLIKNSDDCPDVVIFDSTLRCPLDLPFWENKKRKVILVTTSYDEKKIKTFEQKGAVVCPVKENDGRIDIEDALKHLGKLQVRSLFLEPGPQLLGSFYAHLQRLWVIQSKVRAPTGARDWIMGKECDVEESLFLRYLGEDSLRRMI